MKEYQNIVSVISTRNVKIFMWISHKNCEGKNVKDKGKYAKKSCKY